MDRIPVVALTLLLVALLLLPIANSVMGQGTSGAEWSDKERKLIASLSLQKLPALPADPSNHVADDPAAAKLGRALFFDTRLSSNGKVACATCHIADRQFQDDVARARGVGRTARRTMPIAGTAYSPFVFWDGRKDSQWSQALGPLESAVEHGGDRTALAHLLAATYREPYEGLFGPMPDLSHLPPHAAPAGTDETVAAWTTMSDRDHDTVNRIFANLGKSIEAYERGIMPGESRFDRYAASLASQTKPASAIMTPQEIAGLKIFIGKGSCINCHSGPLLTEPFPQHRRTSGGRIACR
jgi:cytochrome c peroxidase